ncbi:MAG: MG2 domain-containing protein [Nitrososphaera sp.]
MNESGRMTLWACVAIAFGILAASITVNHNAYAQADQAANQGEQANQTAGKSEEAKTMYKPSYSGAQADSKNTLTIQPSKHLYKPGEEVTIEGSVWTNLLAQLGDTHIVTVIVTDNKGNVVADEGAELDSDGNYSMTFMLLEDAELGAYTINATIQADVEVLDTLEAGLSAELNNTVKFVVVSPVAFAVKAENRDFEVDIASNSSNVKEVAFEQAEKKVSFKVEGETGTRGVAQVTLPKELLSGQMVVSIDGRVIAEDSNDVIVTSDTATEMTLEINYPHSEHTIEITGTSVIPEFPISTLVMASAIGSLVGTLALKARFSRARST